VENGDEGAISGGGGKRGRKYTWDSWKKFQIRNAQRKVILFEHMAIGE